MFVDASALCAVLADEPDAASLASRIDAAPRRLTSSTAVWETVVALAKLLSLSTSEAHQVVLEFFDRMNVELVPIPPEAAFLALEAFDRFGKGRHPAGLNFGDCFAYACARHFGMPLLFKGNDFSRTDIEAA